MRSKPTLRRVHVAFRPSFSCGLASPTLEQKLLTVPLFWEPPGGYEAGGPIGSYAYAMIGKAAPQDEESAEGSEQVTGVTAAAMFQKTTNSVNQLEIGSASNTVITPGLANGSSGVGAIVSHLGTDSATNNSATTARVMSREGSTAVSSTNPNPYGYDLNWILEDPDNLQDPNDLNGNTNYTPFGGAFHVSFNATYGGPSTDPNLFSHPGLSLISTFEDVTIDGNGLTITNPTTGAIYYSDPNFLNGATDAYTLTVNLPTTARLPVGMSYNSSYVTGVNGVLAPSATSAQATGFYWSFIMNY